MADARLIRAFETLGRRIGVFSLAAATVIGCSNSEGSNSQSQSTLEVVAQSTRKVCQLIGDLDRQTQQPTLNQTLARYAIFGTDLGIPVHHDGRLYLLFGDTVSPTVAADGDAVATTTDTTPDDCLELSFFAANGNYKPIDIPGVSQGAFEVPTAGVSVDDTLYIYHTTDHSESVTMGRTVLAASEDGETAFRRLYDLSTAHFINLAVVKFRPSTTPLTDHVDDDGEVLVVLGSGKYRESTVRLFVQPAGGIGDKDRIRYFSGTASDGTPQFSKLEADAAALFDSSCVGELSAAWLDQLRQWVVLYNCTTPGRRGILMRSAPEPWGPWSEPLVLFDADRDGYCRFMHKSWQVERCDSVHDPGREDEWGGEYGPYIINTLTRRDGDEAVIYFTMSTWNPYTVVLMTSRLKLR